MLPCGPAGFVRGRPFGLDAALSALAACCTVPVEVETDIPVRPGVAAESAAYFIVAEALMNVSKHAQPNRAHVSVGVRDDGVGGAAVTGGTGIAGLQRRVAALDGTFLLDNPRGGATRVVAELPCGS